MNGNELILLRRIEELENYIKRVPEVGGVWQDWTPNLNIVFGDQVFSNVVGSGRYCIVGKLCSFTANITFDLSGATGSWGRIYVPFPLTAKAATPKFIFTGWGKNGSYKGLIGYTYSTTVIFVGLHDASNWTSGTGKLIQISGTYEIA